MDLIIQAILLQIKFRDMTWIIQVPNLAWMFQVYYSGISSLINQVGELNIQVRIQAFCYLINQAD